ncbi:pyridoxine/pyridoxamine 5'-phosphate oxidase 2-like isoform X1 [Bidens hawaiensis]|uniref:pyridoxine/pyridoxamine 5'-phosphate oxidase 2-like isoform X1 n=1 Tax=Bidens hawaiensis TaxID=980011 RepID=UPI00404B756B
MGSTTAAPWKQLLLNAFQSNSHLRHSSYFQLATVGPNGMPANRTVVFRGFQDATNKIQINTDSRTHKIQDLNHCPFAEICWYFTDSWEQFRINGPVDVIDGSNPDSMKLQQREKAWFASSPKSRLQYLGPNPGLPSLGDQPDQGPSSLDPAAGPVPAFCLLVLDPHQVDYLNLKSNERISFSRKIVNEDVSWNSEKVNP